MVSDYVALSYVWGLENPGRKCRHEEVKGGELIIGKIPSGEHPRYHLRNSLDLVRNHPCQTVKDCIELVKKIGFRYLWVDEYCIGSNARQREFHINQMDRIYEGAVLTICALSGDSKHLGLPGISLPLQIPPQPYVDLDSERIVATRLTDSLLDTESSPWNKRAWTMQEASLSRRLLCFTELSVFWVYKDEIFHDSIDIADRGSRPTASIPAPTAFNEFPFSLDQFGGYFDMPAFQSIIVSYTNRHLTKASDALAAISGLFSRITQMRGVEFSFGHPKADFIHNLLWIPEDPIRRTEFPSWAWLGWEGEMSLVIWLENNVDNSQTHIFSLEVVEIASDTHYVAEKEIARVVNDHQLHSAPVLAISSRVAKLEVFYANNCDEDDQSIESTEDDMWCLNVPHSHDLRCAHEELAGSFLTPIAASEPVREHRNAWKQLVQSMSLFF
jgi:hypothetical protein